MAKNYIDNLSEETKKGCSKKRARESGRPLRRSATSTSWARTEKRTITRTPLLAPLIRSMFERYATGQHSLKEIAKLARQDGMQYPKSRLPVPTFHHPQDSPPIESTAAGL